MRYTSDANGVTRWDGTIEITDARGELVVLQARAAMYPVKRDTRTTHWMCEGLAGTFQAFWHHWCRQVLGQLQFAVENAYNDDNGQ